MARKIKEMSEVELLAAIMREDSKINEAQALIKPIEARRNAAIDRRDRFRNALADLKENDMAYIIKDVNAYEQWRRMCPKQTYPNGYWSETNEQAFKLMFNYKEAPSQELIDFIWRYDSASTRTLIGVFRHDCGERGSWLVECIGGRWVIFDERGYDYRYHSKYEFECDKLEDMLAYVAERHYYRNPAAESRGYEDDDE